MKTILIITLFLLQAHLFSMNPDDKIHTQEEIDAIHKQQKLRFLRKKMESEKDLTSSWYLQYLKSIECDTQVIRKKDILQR
jgi:hypothetical protein